MNDPEDALSPAKKRLSQNDGPGLLTGVVSEAVESFSPKRRPSRKEPKAVPCEESDAVGGSLSAATSNAVLRKLAFACSAVMHLSMACFAVLVLIWLAQVFLFQHVQQDHGRCQ